MSTTAAQDIATLRQNIVNWNQFLHGGLGEAVNIGGVPVATLLGLIGSSASPEPPVQTWPGRHWYDTTDPLNPVLNIRNDTDTGWIALSLTDLTNNRFETKADAEAATIPTWLDVIQLFGHTSPGDGGAGFYKRVSAAPEHIMWLQSADGAFWELVPDPYPNALQNGADPTGTVDASDPVQGAIDAGGRFYKSRVRIPAGEYLLGKTVHAGYGDIFNSVFVDGDGKNFRGTPTLSGTTLRSTHYSDPDLNVNGSRWSQLNDFALVGAAKDTLLAFIGDDSSMLDRENWYQELRDAGFTGVDLPDAPSAGIVIGGYSGAAPLEPYSPVPYPAFTGLTDQYGRNLDSGTIVSGVYFFGHENAYVLGPVTDGNHDFCEGRDCNIDRCVIGVSIGPSQARRSAWRDLEVARVHTVVTNRKHGVQQGRFDALWSGLTVGGMVVQLFDLTSASTGGILTLQNMYAESLSQLGEFSDPNSLPSIAVVIRGSSITWNATASDAYVVGSVIKGSTNDQVIIENTRIRSRSAVCFGLVDVHIDKVINVPDEPVKPYQRAAFNTLSGGLIPNLLENPPFVALMRTYDIDNGGVNAQGATDKRHRNSRRNECIPHAMTEGRCFGFGEWSEKLMPVPAQTPAQQLSVTLTGRTLSMVNTNLSSSNTDRPFQRACLPGCVWVHVESGTFFFVRSADPVTGQMFLEMQNNYKFNGTDYEILDTTYDPQNATYYCVNALVYAPERALTGDVTDGSAVITNVRDAFNGAPLTDFGLQVGDRFADEYYPYPTFVGVGSNRLEIQAIDTVARTITLAGAFTYTGRIPLNFWYRQPPANEASR